MAEPFNAKPTERRFRGIPILEPLEGLPIPVLEPIDAVSANPTIAFDEPLPYLEPVHQKPPAATRNPLVRAFRFIGRGVRFIGWVLEWVFGAATLMVGLAVLAALPIIQFLSLGYLLEAGGRVARTGRLRDGFIGVRLAARLGGVVLGCWLLLWPVRLVASMARSAQIIDPGGKIAGAWRVGLFTLIVLTALHISATCARGGRLRNFLWPFNVFWFVRRLFRGGYYAEARDAVWDTAISLRLPYYFWLGCRGSFGAMVWLALPVSLLALGQWQVPIAPLFGFVGAFMLAFVLLYLPFLQMRLAATQRWSAVFELRAVRAAYRRAPWAFAFAFVLTLAFALPLYLLKIEIVPREAAWLPSLVFIAFIFPARLLTGWALSRAGRREEPRHWFFRWTGRIPLLPAAAFYVLIVFFSQYTSWNGVWSLYEQHAFLVPVPFFGM